MRKYKLLNSLFIITVMFFMSVSSVFAIEFDIEKDNDNLFFNCSSSDKCVPLCIYGDNQAMISYYYSDFADSSNGQGWGISYIIKEFDTIINYNFFKYNIYYITDSLIPKTDVYSADEYISNGKELVDWSSSDLHNQLDSSFVCPKYMVSDDGNTSIFVQVNDHDSITGANDELCFSSSKTTCEKLDNLFNGIRLDFKISDTMELTYSLSDTINNVNNEVFKRSYLGGSTPTEKMEFLVKLDSNVKFLSSLTPEQNAKNNCQYFASKTKDDGGVSYTQSIMKGDYVVNQYFSELDRTYSRVVEDLGTNAVRYPEIFTYDIQKNMLIRDKKYRNEQFKKVDTLLENNIYNSLKYVSEVCSDINVDFKIDEPGVRSTVEKNYDLMRFEDPNINLDEKFKCSDIFTEEIVDIISTAYFILEMVGLAILVIFSALDYIKIFLNDDADSLKKSNSKLLKRLIIVVILFLLPGLVNFVLRVFNVENVEGIDEENRLCVRISNK